MRFFVVECKLTMPQAFVEGAGFAVYKIQLHIHCLDELRARQMAESFEPRATTFEILELRDHGTLDPDSPLYTDKECAAMSYKKLLETGLSPQPNQTLA